ncbi:hypothetical protein ACHAPT_010592 [Fusarium lateritium]
MPSAKVFTAVLAALAVPLAGASPCRPKSTTSIVASTETASSSTTGKATDTTATSTNSVATSSTTGISVSVSTTETQSSSTESQSSNTETQPSSSETQSSSTISASASTTSSGACTYYTPLEPAPEDCGNNGFADSTEGVTIIGDNTAYTVKDCGNLCGKTLGCVSFSFNDYAIDSSPCTLYTVPREQLGFYGDDSEGSQKFYDLLNCFGCGHETASSTTASSSTESASQSSSETVSSSTETASSSTVTVSSSTETASSSTVTASSSTETASSSTETASSSTQTASSSTESASSSTETASSSTESASSSTVTASSSTETASSSTESASSSTASSSTETASSSTETASSSTATVSSSTETASSSTETASSSTVTSASTTASSTASTETTTASSTASTASSTVSTASSTMTTTFSSSTIASTSTTATASTTTSEACVAYTPITPAPAGCGAYGTVPVSCENHWIGLAFEAEDDVTCGKECLAKDGCKSYSYDSFTTLCQLYDASLSDLEFKPCNYQTPKYWDIEKCYACAPEAPTTTTSASTTTSEAPSSTSAVCPKYTASFSQCEKDATCGTRGYVINKKKIGDGNNKNLGSCAKSCIETGTVCEFFMFTKAQNGKAAKCILYKEGTIVEDNFKKDFFYEPKCFSCKWPKKKKNGKGPGI